MKKKDLLKYWESRTLEEICNILDIQYEKQNSYQEELRNNSLQLAELNENDDNYFNLMNKLVDNISKKKTYLLYTSEIIQVIEKISHKKRIEQVKTVVCKSYIQKCMNC